MDKEVTDDVLQKLVKAGKIKEAKALKNPQVKDTFTAIKPVVTGNRNHDGTYNKTRKRFVMESTREKQAEYYSEVVSSLGVKVTLSNYNRKFKK